MIIQTGHQNPTAEQRRMICANADGEFTGILPANFGPVPTFEGWQVDSENMVPLRMRCVPPHRDGWIGRCPTPKRYLSVFWLTKAPPGTDFHLHVRNDRLWMTAGQWALFNDRLMHSVFAERTWHGVAYQLRPVGDAK